MEQDTFRHIYGPVPSRRLGRSLGIDLVPYKTCTYDCIYCQLGRTTSKTLKRQAYTPVEEILEELKSKLAQGSTPDYISLSGSGEPTLHAHLGDLIMKIKSLTAIPLAVLTNGSLLWQEETREALMEADLVLPSLDAGDERLFRYVNRPHKEISFARLFDGLAEFTRRFPKSVWLEVFLLAGITGVPAEVKRIAALVRKIRPAQVQLNTVMRPPCEDLALPVPLNQMESLAQRFDPEAEVIYEGVRVSPLPATPARSDAELLALLNRRPTTAQDIAIGLGWHPAEVAKKLQSLIQQGLLAVVRRNGHIFYVTGDRRS